MSLREQLLDRLDSNSAWGYHVDGPAATEPTATAAIALLCGGRTEAATRAFDWLVRTQQIDGRLGVTATDPDPAWPTALAVLAFSVAGSRYDGRRQRAIDWLLGIEGTPVERTPQLGHDSTLVGWPWVVPTHSWAEPTALAVLALRATNHSDHPRCREATRLLADRLLPDGGCNYGNTRVLGQMLRPHVMPTGVVLWALAGADTSEMPPGAAERIAHSLDYLEQQLAEPISAAALAYTTLALAAHGRDLAAASPAIDQTVERHVTSQRKSSPWQIALLALAAVELGPVATGFRPSFLTQGATVS